MKASSLAVALVTLICSSVVFAIVFPGYGLFSSRKVLTPDMKEKDDDTATANEDFGTSLRGRDGAEVLSHHILSVQPVGHEAAAAHAKAVAAKAKTVAAEAQAAVAAKVEASLAADLAAAGKPAAATEAGTAAATEVAVTTTTNAAASAGDSPLEACTALAIATDKGRSGDDEALMRWRVLWCDQVMTDGAGAGDATSTAGKFALTFSKMAYWQDKEVRAVRAVPRVPWRHSWSP
jgi:hypothetical protein